MVRVSIHINGTASQLNIKRQDNFGVSYYKVPQAVFVYQADQSVLAKTQIVALCFDMCSPIGFISSCSEPIGKTSSKNGRECCSGRADSGSKCEWWELWEPSKSIQESLSELNSINTGLWCYLAVVRPVKLVTPLMNIAVLVWHASEALRQT